MPMKLKFAIVPLECLEKINIKEIDCNLLPMAKVKRVTVDI